MFNKKKQSLLKQKKVKRYLSYAIGEIILIVLGITIAVFLNNWNQEEANTEIRNGIYTVIVNDLKSDTTSIKSLIKYYEKVEPEFLKVMNDSLSSEDEIFTTLMTSQRLVTLNTRGFNQLSDFKNSINNNTDSLTFKITEFYSVFNTVINEYTDLISDDIIEIIKDWRDNYSWFRPVVKSQKATKEAKPYFIESLDYKNKVTYRHILVYENYIPTLKKFLKKSEIILKEIESRLEKE